MENICVPPKKRYRGYLTSLNPVIPKTTRLRLEQQEHSRQNFQEVANNFQLQEECILNGCEQVGVKNKYFYRNISMNTIFTII